MQKHKDQFIDLLNEINEQNIDYVIIRGFLRLPESPDNDIDLIAKDEDFDRCISIIKKRMKHNYSHNHGFAEYIDMKNISYYTLGPDDPKITHYRFYVDTDNGFFFKSPINNFTTYWTVPLAFSNYVHETKIKRELGDTYYYIPSTECELTLQILRNVLDLKGKWQQKSINRVNDLIEDIEEEELKKCIAMVFSREGEVFDKLKENKFNEIFKIVI